MEIFLLFSVLITLAALFSYLNVRILKLPSGISLMLLGALAALTVICIGYISGSFTALIEKELSLIDFSDFLLGILLSFLLFAGALHVNLSDLLRASKSIASFAVMGTLISTVLVGYGFYFIMDLLDKPVPIIYCLLLGALISPTDPIAVMGILKQAGLSKAMETNIIGESLFNDGIGVVVFATLLKIASVGIGNFGAGAIGLLFLQEAGGGLLIGGLVGLTGYQLMKSIDHFQTEILISLAMVMGGYSLCHLLHVSGPLAMVVAGIMTGNRGKALAMSDMTRDYLGKFWEVIDEILNAVLFLLIGLEIVIVDFKLIYIIIGLVMSVVVVTFRFVALYTTAGLFRFIKDFPLSSLKIMAWGGLRGGISVALALSLPTSPFKNIIVPVTFVIVLFSILIQGLTISRLIKRYK
ncbi:MAG: sodium:proton antiporter [Dyadobacter sp. 50-39]|uniref:cation:proton antiporter n=1 Tax=Dyadobacter sp. 50-39 TaxID=1895756 RepID=UPI00095F74A1|nr:sodium:proton antiporter [Dyadobacter sp. 50-39]OJV15243.1 MAG: sodium:proton antiporter [Dyadobacter sp. 50-39]